MMAIVIILLMASLMVGRLFSETLGVLPRFIDLLDLVLIPLIFLWMIPVSMWREKPVKLEYEYINSRLLHLSVLFAILCGFSAVINYERTNILPVSLYIFGMLEGPILFAAINLLVKDHDKFIKQIQRFGFFLLCMEIGTVFFINIPRFVMENNPDVISGTFGGNGYQFSALLIIIGGYFLGKMMVSKMGNVYGIAIQIFIFGIFFLMQYRTGTPGFLLTYAITLGVLFGRKLSRLIVIGTMVGIIAYAGLSLIGSSGLNFRFEDLITLFEDVSVVGDRGKFLAYVKTVEIYQDMPHAVFVGTGPGTLVSRAAVTFLVDVKFANNKSPDQKAKGVGATIQMLFGDVRYSSDVYDKYIYPLNKLEALFGSAQFNNTSSSLLAPAAELGLLGIVIVVWMYGILIRRALKFMRYALKTKDPELLPWASALFIGLVYLVFLSPLDNYLETARITLPIWLMFWMVGRMYEDRWRAQLTSMAQAIEIRIKESEPV